MASPEFHKEVLSELKNQPRLNPDQYRQLHILWRQIPKEEQSEFISGLTDKETVGFLRLMLGNPQHNLQIQNQYKLPVFHLALELKPEAFTLTEINETDQAAFPSWIGLALRFNLHEDGTSAQAIGMIHDRFYPGEESQSGWQRDYEEYQRRLEIVEKSKGNEDSEFNL